MDNYIFYDASGNITRILKLSFAADADFLTANTRAGQTAMKVDATHPALSNPNEWQVVSGALQQIVLTSAQLLAAAQQTQLQIIAGSYQAALAAPVAYMGTTFRADKESQTILAHSLTVYNQAGGVPSGFYFLDANNNQVAMTLAQLQGLGTAVSSQYLAAFQKRVNLDGQIMAATTVSAVQAVVW